MQDVALSVDSCSYVAGKDVNIRLATVLRHAINELTVDFSTTLNGHIVPLYSKPLCERNWPQFQFCGKKKGVSVSTSFLAQHWKCVFFFFVEYIYYSGPVSLNMENIPH
ncbi:hypothetical protein Chor_003095, partial [Crotalus horridus]